ncbi:hypothetical protein GQ457_17G003640 [Hibiscus cannabinus]
MASGPGSQNTEVGQALGLEKSGPVPFLCRVGLTGSIRITYRVTGSAPKGGKPFILHHLFDPTPTKVTRKRRPPPSTPSLSVVAAATVGGDSGHRHHHREALILFNIFSSSTINPEMAQMTPNETLNHREPQSLRRRRPSSVWESDITAAFASSSSPSSSDQFRPKGTENTQIGIWAVATPKIDPLPSTIGSPPLRVAQGALSVGLKAYCTV